MGFQKLDMGQSKSATWVKIASEIEQDPGACGIALTQWRTGSEDVRSDVAADMQRKLKRRGIEASEDTILKALQSLFEPAFFCSELPDCVFHTKLDTDFTANWTPIPRQTGQSVQRKLDTDSTPNWTV
ncbi:hypothetical protein ACFS07_10640 [Undibacterium arcticum]